MLAAVDVGITPIHYVKYDRPTKPESEGEPYAYFFVAGEFEPDEINRRVGLAPSETARAGDTIGNTSD